MSNILNKRLISYNLWMWLLTFSLILMMLFKEVILNILIAFPIAYIIIRQTYYFLPIRYDHIDDVKSNDLYKLLPIKDKILNKYNIFNALIWSLITMLVLIINIYTFNNINIMFNFMSFVGFIIISLIPLIIILLDRYFNKISVPNIGIYSLILFVLIITFPLIDNNNVFKKVLLLIPMLLVLILILNLFKYINNKNEDINTIQFSLFNNSRISKINNTTSYKLINKRNYIDFGFIGLSIYWLFNDEIFSNIIGILFLNIMLIVFMIKKYYLSDNLIRLIPVSTKEKKFACDTYSILYLLLLNISITLFFTFKNDFNINIFIKDILFLLTLAILAYSLAITYYHREKDLFIAVTAIISFICITYALIYFYPTYKIIAIFPIILLAILLIIIDYRHK